MAKKILIVDDSATVRHQLGGVLREAAYEVLEAGGGHEALDHARGNALDLIITDQSMPGMTGLEMVKSLRQSGHETPVIILSGNARYVSADELSDLGKIQFMPKPFDLATLELGNRWEATAFISKKRYDANVQTEADSTHRRSRSNSRP